MNYKPKGGVKSKKETSLYDISLPELYESHILNRTLQLKRLGL